MDLQKYRKKIGFVRFYAMLVAVLCVIFFVGYEFANIQKRDLLTRTTLANKSLGNMKREFEKLQSEFNVLKVELDIAQISNEHSQVLIAQGINREQALKEKVSFYQRVLAPEMTQDGFIVQSMEVTPNASLRNFAIKMILLQHEDVKAVIKGQLNIQLSGSSQGKPVSYSINEFLDEPKASLAFAFKYFQIIEMNLTLPKGFTPERFEINTAVYKYKKKRGSYSTAINWDDAFTEDE